LNIERSEVLESSFNTPFGRFKDSALLHSRFKRHFVPFNCFATLSIQALLRSVQEKHHILNADRRLKAAKRLLNTERSKVFESSFNTPFGRFKNSSTATQCSRKTPQFERCEATIESRVAAIEHRTQ